MRKARYSILFKKKLKKLKGKELRNVLNKKDEILKRKDINFYKNLRYDLKHFKRVHVNDSYVILFKGFEDVIYFIDYEHHDKIYKKKYDF